MKYLLKVHRVDYEKHSVALPTFYEKNIGFMRMKNTGHMYKRPFIKLVDLYTQLCRQLPYSSLQKVTERLGSETMAEWISILFGGCQDNIKCSISLSFHNI